MRCVESSISREVGCFDIFLTPLLLTLITFAAVAILEGFQDNDPARRKTKNEDESEDRESIPSGQNSNYSEIRSSSKSSEKKEYRNLVNIKMSKCRWFGNVCYISLFLDAFSFRC